jgi:hypothetical protein
VTFAVLPPTVICDSRANSLIVSGSLLVAVGAAAGSTPVVTIAINRLACQRQLRFMTGYGDAGNVNRNHAHKWDLKIDRRSRSILMLPTTARTKCSWLKRTVLSAVAHAPDGFVAVFADKQTTVFRDGDSDRATPDFAIGRDEAGHEVLVFAARFAG